MAATCGSPPDGVHRHPFEESPAGEGHDQEAVGETRILEAESIEQMAMDRLAEFPDRSENTLTIGDWIIPGGFGLGFAVNQVESPIGIGVAYSDNTNCSAISISVVTLNIGPIPVD